MPRREHVITHEQGALAQFALELRKARELAGLPSYRRMAATAHYGASALSRAADGKTRPTWDCVVGYLRACNVSARDQLDEWRRRWVAVCGSAVTTDAAGGMVGVANLAASSAQTPPVPHKGSPSPFDAQLEIPPTRSEIPVMLVIRPRLLRAGLAAILSTAGDLYVVAEFDTVDAALRAAPTVHVAVALIDPMTPQDLATAAKFTGPGRDCALLLLVDENTSPAVFAALEPRRGALVNKDIRPDRLRQYVRRAATEGYYFFVDPTLDMERLRPAPNPLTNRERQVLQAVAHGLTNYQIASQLFIAWKTVDSHITSIMLKVGTSNRAQAVLIARHNGWID